MDVVNSVCTTPDGQHIVSGSADKTVRVWASGLSATSTSDDVVLTGERTREERDAEGRKRAIDLDSVAGSASKHPKAEAAAASSSENSGAAPCTELDKVDGLAKLLAHLSADHRAMALKWCVDHDADSVNVIVLMEMDDEFVASMGLKVGGLNERLLRKRLAVIREAVA